MRDRLEVSAGLRLRRWSERDVASVLAAAERWLTLQGECWEPGSGFAFAVVDGSDVVLGNVAVGSVDRRHRTGWVSYWTTALAR